MGQDVLRKMLSKHLLLCRIFTVSGAVSLLFLPFSWIFFFSLENTISKVFYSLVDCHILMFSEEKAHNSVPWFFVGFNLLLKTSCFLWVTFLLQLEQCILASVYLVFCQMELAHRAIVVSWVGSPCKCFREWWIASVQERKGFKADSCWAV